MDNAEASLKVLGEPVVEELDDDHRRTSRNLLVVAAVTVFYFGFELKVTGFAVVGTKFEHLPSDAINIALFVFLLYLFIQFGWKSLDHVRHLKIRLTGTPPGKIRGSIWGAEEDDTPDDPRNSSLYAWWSQLVGRIRDYDQLADQLNSTAKALEDWANKAGNADMPNINHVQSTGSQITTVAQKLTNRLEEVKKIIDSKRVGHCSCN